MGYGPWGLSFWEFFILLWLVLWFFKPKDSKRVDRMFDEFQSEHAREKASLEETLDAYEADLDSAEDKIEKLEARIRVLERIVTDEHNRHKKDALSEEIESLRQ